MIHDVLAILSGTTCGLIVAYITVRIQTKRAEKEIKDIANAAEEKVVGSIRKATAIEALLTREMFKIVAARFPYPFDDKQVTDYIGSRVNLN